MQASPFFFALSPSLTARSGGLFKNHHGFLEFRKWSGFNCLHPPASPPARCVFRSARTRLTVERIHLPPDIAEEGDRGTKATTGTKRMENIDF